MIARRLTDQRKREDNMALELTWSGSPADVEDRLAVQCRHGSAAAFDEIVSRYHARLFRFAYRMLLDRAEAEDAVQEAFVRAYRAMPAYRPDGYFSSWIYRIALNECRRRAKGRRNHVPLDGLEQAATTPDPQQSVLTDERHRRLREAVDVLPEHYRIVMMLFYFDDMSVEQVSKTLSISVSAVKVRLHRGRERLAIRLGEP
jgi:RNA polymerase sigma-70 factor (ECF subfamily)